MLFFWRDKHIFEDTDNIERYFFCLDQEFISFWKSPDNKQDINQTKKKTDNKRHFDSISKQPSSYGRTDNKSHTKYCSKKSEIGSTFFMVYCYISKNRLDRTNISCSSSIYYSRNQIYPNISRNSNQAITYQTRNHRHQKNNLSSIFIRDCSENGCRKKSKQRK